MRRTADLLAQAVKTLGGQERSGQQTMAEAVASALDTGTHLLVQAGTGTGKSLAYLVPALDHALRTNERVIVSTATLALQAQIIDRDLPRLIKANQSAWERKPAVAVLKGRRNYVCKHKLAGGYPEDDASTLFDLGADAAALAGGQSTEDRRATSAATALGEEINRIRSWERTTDTGDRDDLLPGVSDRAWAQVSVNAFDCLGQNCPMYGECFAEKARAVAADADLVVTNHALLAIDAFGDNTVLPEHDAVIIDEAHELRDRVTGALTGQLSATMITTACQSAKKHTSVQEGVINLLETAGQRLATAISAAREGLMPKLPEALAAPLAQVRDAARQVVSDASGKNEDKEADAGRQMARARVQEVFELAERIAEPSRNDVVWIHRSEFRNKLTEELVVAPLSVAGTMRAGIFEHATVIATSATLALGGKFEPVAASLGLAGPEAPRWDGIDVGSPFDYAKQSILYIASDLPKPGRSSLSDEALERMAELITASGGATLGLFSSRAAAHRAAEEMRERLDLPILLQGESSLAGLVTQFAAEEETCLFGTMSLWQGVDVPGKTCRLVLIDRIPFPRPDDPLMQARARDAQQRGVNGFMAVSATHAALRLAQGAGRLIRSVDDRGVVAVLDMRLATASYGGFLTASLPPMWPSADRASVTGALQRLASG